VTREFGLFIQDIKDAMDSIEAFIGDIDFDEFLQDDKTKSAVVWKIGVIGEATKHIPQLIRSKYKQLPWKSMAKMRDKITHSYFGIDYKIVTGVAKQELPEIRPYIDKVLADLKGA
jgi:uncharacterized protein with HEPN domain